MAGTFGAMMATVSPSPIPRRASAEARRRARRRELRVREDAVAVDHRGLVRVHRRGPREEAGRRQGSVIGRAAGEPLLEGFALGWLVDGRARRPSRHTPL